jgi:hypothetical protein
MVSDMIGDQLSESPVSLYPDPAPAAKAALVRDGWVFSAWNPDKPNGLMAAEATKDGVSIDVWWADASLAVVAYLPCARGQDITDAPYFH